MRQTTNEKLTLAAAVLYAAMALQPLMLLTACSDDVAQQQGPDLGGQPIVLTLGQNGWATGVEEAEWGSGEAGGTTRANSSSGHGSAGNTWCAGDRFTVHFLSGSTAESAVYQVSGQGTSVTASAVSAATLPGNPQPRYVDGATAADVSVRCYFPNMVPLVPQTFTVAQNQHTTTQYGASDAYTRSDLMYGSGTANSAITFEHRVAKVKLRFTGSSGFYLKEAYVIGGCSRTVNIAYPETLTPGTTLSDPVGDTDATRMTIWTGNTYASGWDASVVLPPQRICQQTTPGEPVPFIRVVTQANSKPITFTLDPSTLEAGKMYTIEVNNISADNEDRTYHLGSFDNGQTITLQADRSYASASPGLYHVGGTTFRMVPVKGGTMDNLYSDNKTPNWNSGYNVTLTDFQIAETECTQALWREVMGTNPSTGGTEFLGDNRPVNGVSWNMICQADGFLDKLNAATSGQRPAGWYFTLPTSAQFEYAARGGQHSRGYRFSGSNTLNDVAWNSANSDAHTHDVATLRANELGLYDMHGNLFEWCADWKEAKDAGDYTDPTGPATGSGKYLVAGNWEYGETTTYFNWSGGATVCGPDRADNETGFRLCLRKIKVGDLYFSDGSVGTIAEHPGKTPIAIVFSTTPSAADQALGYRNGYAMALKKLPTAMAWCAASINTLLITSTHQYNDYATAKADLDGLSQCRTAKANADDDNNTYVFSDLTAIYAAMVTYNATVAAAPAASSGWYLPSVGQQCLWIDLSGNITNAPTSSDSGNSKHFAWNGNPYPAAFRNGINAKLATAGSGTYDAFVSGENYWSSTEKWDGSGTWVMGHSDGQLFIGNNTPAKSMDRYVRPVLAF